MEENSIRKLLTSIKCSACGQHYEAGNIEVLGHREDLWFFSVFCPTCPAHYLIVAVVTKERGFEIVTDLTKAELDRFRSTGRVTDDEVLEMHSFLKSFDGDFSQLFKQKQV